MIIKFTAIRCDFCGVESAPTDGLGRSVGRGREADEFNHIPGPEAHLEREAHDRCKECEEKLKRFGYQLKDSLVDLTY